METAVQTPFETNFISTSATTVSSSSASCSLLSFQKEAELRKNSHQVTCGHQMTNGRQDRPIRNEVNKGGRCYDDKEYEVDDDEFSRVTRQIAVDIVRYYSLTPAKKRSRDPNRPPPVNVYAKNMRRLVEKMIDKHDLVFQSMVTHDLRLAEVDVQSAFRAIADQLFMADGQRNWGRVVALFALVARLTEHLVDRQLSDDEYVLPLAEYLTDYVTHQLRPWILANGGWDGFVKHFPEDSNLESKILKGLLVTGIGLGVLATFFASR